MTQRRKRISIISRESNKKTRDIAMLEAELLKRGADVRVLSKLLTKDKSIKALGYAGHVVKQEAAILASDVVVLDTYCIPASMLPHRKGTKVVQMWHALGAIKRFGWQTVGKEGGSSEKTAHLMRMHHGYDYVICASDVTAEHFCEAFRVDRSKIVKYGLPRIDYIKSVSAGDRRQKTAARIFDKYPQLKETSSSKEIGAKDEPVLQTEEEARSEKPVLQTEEKARDERPGKKNILYAPTFRRGGSVDLQAFIDAFDPDEYTIIVKLHPVYKREAESLVKARSNVIIDGAFTSNDWLAVADIIISDYSSFAIEATLADKPLYIYAYDIESYEKTTGLNMDFSKEPISPYVFKDAQALAASISRDDYDIEAMRAFRNKYIDIDTDNCTAALADYILSLADR